MKGSASMPLDALFAIFGRMMEVALPRGNYSMMSNNCIRFKNDVLEELEKEESFSEEERVHTPLLSEPTKYLKEDLEKVEEENGVANEDNGKTGGAKTVQALLLGESQSET